MLLRPFPAGISRNYLVVNVDSRSSTNNARKYYTYLARTQQVTKTQQITKIQRVQHICAAETTTEDKSNDASKNITANLLGILAGAFAVAWIASVLLPKVIMQNMLSMGISTEGKSSFIGFVSYFPVMVACLKSLQSAVQNNRLGSDTYRRINLGLMAISVGVLVNCFDAGLWTVTGVSVQAAVHAVVLLIAGMGYFQYPFFEASGLVGGFVSSLFKKQKWNSFVYVLIILACFYGFYILGINTQSYIFEGLNSAIDIFMKRSTGIACLLYIMISATLKDAANRDRLGASTFKNLNIGMFLMSFSTCLNFAWAYKEGAVIQQSAFISQEVFTGLAAAFFFSQIFAKKKK